MMFQGRQTTPASRGPWYKKHKNTLYALFSIFVIAVFLMFAWRGFNAPNAPINVIVMPSIQHTDVQMIHQLIGEQEMDAGDYIGAVQRVFGPFQLGDLVVFKCTRLYVRSEDDAFCAEWHVVNANSDEPRKECKIEPYMIQWVIAGSQQEQQEELAMDMRP